MPQRRQVLPQLLEDGTVGLAQHQRLLAAPLFVLLLDRFDGAQLLLPGALQGPRNQAVLRLDRIVLAPRPLGLVTGALAAQAPLLLELARLLLQLSHHRYGDRDPVRRERLKKGALDEGIDRQRAHFLAERRRALVAVGTAAIAARSVRTRRPPAAARCPGAARRNGPPRSG